MEIHIQLKMWMKMKPFTTRRITLPQWSWEPISIWTDAVKMLTYLFGNLPIWKTLINCWSLEDLCLFPYRQENSSRWPSVLTLNVFFNFFFEFSVETQCAAVDRNKMDARCHLSATNHSFTRSAMNWTF